MRALKEKRITSFAMELVPRISRAQSMDALSSQAAVAGYKAVLIARQQRSTSSCPMLTTAAGTIRPAQVLVIGAGVAGLQAIATARRLGAVVEAYDVRSRHARADQVARREVRRDRRQRRRRRRLRARADGGGEGEAAGSAGCAHRRRRLRDHDRRRSGPPGAAHHLAGRGRAHEARRRDRRHRRRERRQLRADARRRDRRSQWRAASSGRSTCRPRVAYHASEMYARNLLNFLKPAHRRTARSRSTGTTKCSRQPCSRTTARSATKPTRKARGGLAIDGRRDRALHLHAGRVHRLRDHRARCR